MPANTLTNTCAESYIVYAILLSLSLRHYQKVKRRHVWQENYVQHNITMILLRLRTQEPVTFFHIVWKRLTIGAVPFTDRQLPTYTVRHDVKMTFRFGFTVTNKGVTASPAQWQAESMLVYHPSALAMLSLENSAPLSQHNTMWFDCLRAMKHQVRKISASASCIHIMTSLWSRIQAL